MSDDPALTHGDGFLESFLSSAFGSAAFDELAGKPEAACADDPDDRPPEILARYPIGEQLGGGGVGQVFRAHDPDLRREVAIKVLRHRHAGDAAAVARFLDEARVCSRLQHPGIVPIHEMGRLADGRPYFTMKIVDGHTLQQRLRERRPGSLRANLEIFEKICQTLAYAHAHGVVHADLKPQNIMLGAFGEVQVMDWGFAVDVGATGDALASRPRIAGTPSYMAPEQARGTRDESPRTDVFGLGAILCEILTGAPPYTGSSQSEVLLRASRGWLDDATARIERCGADPTLIDLTLRCLSPLPDDRPADASAVAQRVTGHLASIEERVRTSELAAAAAQTAVVHERRARRLTAALAAAVLLSVAFPGAILLNHKLERERRRANTGHAVSAAMGRAQLLVEQAAADAADGSARWGDAVAAAELAKALAADPDTPAELARSAGELLGETTARQLAARTEARIVRRLDELHSHDSSAQPGRAEQEYHAAFAELGLDIDALDAAPAADRLLASKAAIPLIDALDQWANLRRSAGIPSKSAWMAPLDVALLADPDPLRTRIRTAIRTSDAEALRALAAAGIDRDVPVRTLVLLARSLSGFDLRSEAIDIYRLAHQRDPSDYWTSHDLASLITLLPSPPIDEALQLYSMALAVRPDSAHARSDLGHALLLKGRPAPARLLLERALELSPEDSRIHFLLGLCHWKLGVVDPAITWLTRAFDAGTHAAFPPLHELLLQRCEFTRARECLHRAAAWRTDPAWSVMMAGLLHDSGELTASRELLEEAVLPRQPDNPDALRLLRWIALETGRHSTFDALRDRLQAALIARGTDLSADDAQVDARRIGAVAGLDQLVLWERDGGIPAPRNLPPARATAALAQIAARSGRDDVALFLLDAAMEKERALECPPEFLAELADAAARRANADPADSRQITATDRAFAWSVRLMNGLQADLASGQIDRGHCISLLYRLDGMPDLRALRERLPDHPAGVAWQEAFERTRAALLAAPR